MMQVNGSGYSADFWIDHLQLKPHPEGGYFTEIYRDAEEYPAAVLPARYDSKRNVSTSIYYLLKSENISRLHKLHSNEIWHFYTGSTLHLHLLHEKNSYTKIKLGPHAESDEQFQVVIPKYTYFGANLPEPDTYALVGCTMAPGFEYDDFTLGEKSELIEMFPDHTRIIHQLLPNI